MWKQTYMEAIIPEDNLFPINKCSKKTERCVQFSSVQFSSSVMSDSLQPHESQHARPPCPSPSLISHLILCRPLLFLPPIPPSITVFSNESTLRIRWPKHWSFSFSISSSNEHPGLISFRMDWLNLLQAKGRSRLFSNTTVEKHQFFWAQLSL